MKCLCIYPTEIGRIGIAANSSAITNLYLPNDHIPLDDAFINETDMLKEAGRQLQLYLAGILRNFDLPLAPDGTEFSLRVWKSLTTIPCGETRSYGEIAQIIGNKKAARAVGRAIHCNPIPIFIPCHRVIGSNGKLIGYGGGLQTKSFLLNLEKQGDM